jgi:Putative methyltransferase
MFPPGSHALMPIDWVAWHERYKTNRGLKARLRAVCGQIENCLSACPPGPIRVVSVCSGDGRDLLSALINHPRERDVVAYLIDTERALVDAGQDSANISGLGDQLHFIVGDATLPSSYKGMLPADLVLVCGVFGHVLKEDLQRLVHSLGCMCKTGGYVIWTRHAKAWDGESHVPLINQLFEQTRFEQIGFSVTEEGASCIGTYRYTGEPAELSTEETVFMFTGCFTNDAPNA